LGHYWSSKVKNRFFAAILTAVLALPLGKADATALRDVFKRVSGSVVVVLAESKSPGSQGPADARGLGSGVLISQSGRILTAAHVVEAADRVRIRFASGAVVPARVVAADPMADLALLEAAQVPRDAVVARIGDSDKVDVADQVFVVGAPYGISETLTVGYVSARRTSSSEPGDSGSVELFQTDAAMAPGSSGGPMFNMQGEVVGIVSRIVSRSGGSEGIGFAVTSNAAKELLLDAPHIWTGVSIVPLSGELARALNLPQPAGLLVMHAAEDSPGAQMGLRAGSTPALVGGVPLMLGGDIILTVAGVPIEANAANYREIRDRLRRSQPGERIPIVVLRAGRVVELSGASMRAADSN
jgi:S1-C subfamily serine protease